MKNVLIPTDFTPNSLDVIATVAKTMEHKINIILFHAFDMPDNLRDAMHLAGVSEQSQLMTEALRVKCKKIKAAHTNISNINFRMMYGTTVHAFDNYAEANDIDLIVWPNEYIFVPVTRSSVDPSRMFTKSGIALMRNMDGRKVAQAAKPQADRTQRPPLRNPAIAQ